VRAATLEAVHPPVHWSAYVPFLGAFVRAQASAASCMCLTTLYTLFRFYVLVFRLRCALIGTQTAICFSLIKP